MKIIVGDGGRWLTRGDIGGVLEEGDAYRGGDNDNDDDNDGMQKAVFL